MKRSFSNLIAALLLCFVASSVSAQFSGSGSGTADDPYRIYNAVQLNQVRNFLGKSNVYFSLEADIDMADWIAENNPVQGWQPIGNSNNSFNGYFDGNGHTISNLRINRPDTDYIGLFGYVTGGDISNLNIVNADYVGKNKVGGISGHSVNVDFTECRVIGIINGNTMVGGIVGYHYNNSDYDKFNCSFNGIIKGVSYCGGIIGYSISESDGFLSIYDCFTFCDIHVSVSDAGGIVGNINNSDQDYTIENCHTICNMNGGNNIGGIIGRIDNAGFAVNINQCYAHIITSYCSTSVGGILGSSSDFNSVHIVSYNNYSTGIIAGERSIGGLLGEHTGSSFPKFYRSYSRFQKISGENTVAGLCNGGTIDYSIAINNVIETTNGNALARVRLGDGSTGNNLAWTLTTMIANGERLPIPADDAENGTSTGISTLKLQATYEGLGWDFNDIWKIEETESFPYFQWQTAPPYFSQTLKKGDTHLSGQCTEQGMVTVRIGDKRYTTQSSGNAWSVDLEEPLAAGDMVEVWVQTDDKMPSYVVCATAGLSGSGTETDPYLITSAEDLQAISGITDDNPYYRLTADIDLADYIAGNGWTPVNLRGHFDGQGHTVSGLQCNTGMAGLFRTVAEGSEIKDLKVVIADNGTVKGSSLTGGLVASNKGSIVNCSVSGIVESEETAGGVAGENSGTITVCSVSGNISGGTSTGGIAGSNTGSISECYTTGTVSSSAASVGGIAGKNGSAGQISDCYSEMVVSASGSNAYGAGIAGYNYGKVEHCYAAGDVTGYNVAGVCGYNSGVAAELKGCVAANSNLSGSKQALRVIGGFSSDATAPGLTDNYAVSDMMVSVNGVPQTIYDDPLNGTAMPESELMKQSAYEALGWNFTDVWKIDEGTSYPYLPQFAVYVSGITLDKTEAELMRGETLQLSATVSPDDADDRRLIWSSGDIDIARVSSNGEVTAVGVGETEITATANDGSGVSAVCRVTVLPIMVTSIILDRESLELFDNSSFQLTATVLPYNATDRTVTWQSTNDRVASVDADGTIYVWDVGETDIIATANDGSGVSATCHLTVIPVMMESITLDKEYLEIQDGDRVKLIVTALEPYDVSDSSLTWTSSDENVATVYNGSSNGCYILAEGVGETDIIASANDGSGVSATCRVTVTPVKVSEVLLGKTELVMVKGQSEKLIPTVWPDNASDKSLTWTSSDESVVTVDNDGNVEAVNAGEADVTATTNDGTDLTATCHVTVIDSDGGVYTIGADGINVLIKDGRIVVFGKDDDEVVTVHTLEGRLVYRGTDNAVDVYSNVFYLVTVRGTTYKVFIP